MVDNSRLQSGFSELFKQLFVWFVIITSIVMTAVASTRAGNIEDPRIALAAFLGIGTLIGLAFHRMYRDWVTFFMCFAPQSEQDAVADVPWSIGQIACFVAIAASATWGIFAMDHGFARTFLGFVGGVAAYEAAVSPLVSLVFPHF